ncbi:MAG: LCP family protein [Clostridia bacterium]|nr:LCP family protein [Clostridia bacterium]
MNEIKNKQKVSHTKKHPQKRNNTKHKATTKTKKSKPKKVLIIIAFIFVILTTIFIIKMNQNGWTYGGLIATFLGHNSDTVNHLDTVYIVVTGESQNLTDTIMICAFNPKQSKLTMMSIPRDMYTGQNKNKAAASDKINTLYSKSPETLVKKINSITGLDLKYYINVDTKGLRELVDAIDGIYYDVPIDMNYDDDTQNLHIHLKAGYQLLDGNKAEQLVRFRHNNDGTSYPASYGDNDIGRMKTQREFLKELLKQIKNKHLILNLSKYVKIARNNTETNVNFDEMIDYIPYLLDFNLEELDSTTLPGQPEKCNGVWLYIPNKSEIESVVNEKFLSLKN